MSVLYRSCIQLANVQRYFRASGIQYFYKWCTYDPFVAQVNIEAALAGAGKENSVIFLGKLFCLLHLLQKLSTL